MSTEKGSGSKTINRPHWKDIAEQQSKDIIKLEQELVRLRANGAEPFDLAKIKAESFAAGVASISKHLIS